MTNKNETEKLLIVDDNQDTLEVLQRNLVARGYHVQTAQAVEEAIGLLENSPVDLVITDMKMPHVSGLDLVRHVRENYTDTEVMMITGYASIEGAVAALKTGAEEYLSKPFTDEELINAVQRALDKLHLRRATHKTSYLSAASPAGLLGESEPMKKALAAIAKSAANSATVLITGESGTGKELVARATHYSSVRASAPFVSVNCGAIPETLLESELFGYVRGAFTGATESRAGFFQTADGGSIFLDEISETTPAMQVKLLRVLEEKEVCMVGSSKPRKVDIRILAATNKDLLALVHKGAFREDLFYRLNVITINLPPLRDRGDDLLLLINHFAHKFSKELDKPVLRISDAAIKVMRNYSWPGNVRELQNLILRLVVMSEGQPIEVTDLPAHMRFSLAKKGNFTRTLAEVEGEYIKNVLESVDGNKSQAAKVLGIDRKTLRKKLETYRLGPDEDDAQE